MPLFIHTVFSSHLNNFIWYFHPLFYSNTGLLNLFLIAVLVFGKYEIHASSFFYVSDYPLVFLFSACGSFSHSSSSPSFFLPPFLLFPLLSQSHFFNVSYTSFTFSMHSFCLTFSFLVLFQILGEMWEEVSLVFIFPSCTYSGELFYPSSLSISSKNAPTRKVIWGRHTF